MRDTGQMRSITTAAAALLMLFVTVDLHASTITVRQDGSGDYTMIGAAVAAAIPGDAIEVGVGVYFESITVNKALSIFSVSGASATVLDGGGVNRLIRVNTAESIYTPAQ